MNTGITYNVAFAVFDGAQILDIAGPIAVLSAASDMLLGRAGYEITICSEKSGEIKMNSPMTIFSQYTWRDINPSCFDILLVSGGMPGAMSARNMPDLLELVRGSDKAGIRICSICTGAFVLAAAGLLDGRKCTTHWLYLNEMKNDYPKSSVLSDVIFHVDGNIWTSAGVTAGIDMALAMVAQDFGTELSRVIAKNMVLSNIREGFQTQIPSNLKQPVSQNQKFNDLLLWIQSNLDKTFSVESLAERCNMSERNFTRRFKEEYSVTALKMITSMRLERAKRYIENTDMDFVQIARICGFTSLESMRLSFSREYGLPPSTHRRNQL